MRRFPPHIADRRVVSRWGRRLLLVLTGSVAAVVWGAAQAQADPADTRPFTIEQPDGTAFQARLFGDEYYNGTETASGYTVLQGADGVWLYAEQATDGSLRRSDARVGIDPAPGRQTHLRDATKVAKAQEMRDANETQGRSDLIGPPGVDGPPRQASVGTQRSLVILAQFNDQSSLGTTPASWSAKYFGPSKSVKDYYAKASYGQLTIAPALESHGTANDGVVGWVTLNMNHPNTTGAGTLSNRTATRLAIQAADQYVDYASYDANGDGWVSNTELHITVIAAGQEASYYGAQDLGYKFLWGHKYVLAHSETPLVDGKYVGEYGYTQFGEMHGDHQAAIGIMVHEIGHDLGLPDLYDTDYGSDGVGRWSVMAFGSWAKTAADAHQGDTPPLPDAWCNGSRGGSTRCK